MTRRAHSSSAPEVTMGILDSLKRLFGGSSEPRADAPHDQDHEHDHDHDDHTHEPGEEHDHPNEP
jgi:ABC-type Zn2+ transport system substrate-binding protein/surface adhesin